MQVQEEENEKEEEKNRRLQMDGRDRLFHWEPSADNPLKSQKTDLISHKLPEAVHNSAV